MAGRIAQERRDTKMILANENAPANSCRSENVASRVIMQKQGSEIKTAKKLFS